MTFPFIQPEDCTSSLTRLSDLPAFASEEYDFELNLKFPDHRWATFAAAWAQLVA